MSTGAVLLAAGRGLRFHKNKPKQWAVFHNEPLFVKSLRTFIRHPSIQAVVLVVSPGEEKKYQRALQKYPFGKHVGLVRGGRFRGESVQKGVRALKRKVDIVLVHDTARPLVTPEIITRVEKAARKYGAALAAWPVPDTLKSTSHTGLVLKTISRKNVWQAQTPQGFRMAWAQKYLLKASNTATDDAELTERKGKKPKIVLGSPFNIKVTYPTDLKICRAFVRFQTLFPRKRESRM